MSEQIIDKIRSLTDVPVTHVVISHWHGDHNFGIHRFAEEYPGVEIIAHEFTHATFNTTRMGYLDDQQNFKEDIVPRLQSFIDARAMPDGRELSDAAVAKFQRLIDDADILEAEFKRSKVTPPTATFTDRYVIDSGDVSIELLFLGLTVTPRATSSCGCPKRKLLRPATLSSRHHLTHSTCLPQPWADTLKRIKALEFEILVPGHGEIQRNADYVDLLIETAEEIVEQRDALVSSGVATEEIAAQLDFTKIEPRFTGGDEYLKVAYYSWFERPFRLAAVKALGDEPMVVLTPHEAIPFDDVRWTIEATEHELLDYMGKQALRIKGGAAWLPDLDVVNAIVEFDIAVAEERGFAGLVFRMQDRENFEHFYIRPHQSGNPDANQYTPVFNGVSAWQLYHGEDFASPTEYSFDDWMSIKVVYAGSNAEVYIDSDEPVLRVTGLRRDDFGGAIGINSANFSAVHFANFRYTPLSTAYKFPWPPDTTDVERGMVMTWEVSTAFDGALLDDVNELDEDLTRDLEWSDLAAEQTGITNLAQVNGAGEGSNTAFARVFVDADGPETRNLQLGYSDKANRFRQWKTRIQRRQYLYEP